MPNSARLHSRRAAEVSAIQGQKNKPSFLGLVVGRVSCVFGVCVPNAFAILRSPAIGFASGGKIFGGSLCGFLGLGVANFEIGHNFQFLSFCTLIIARKGLFVNPFFIFLQLFLYFLRTSFDPSIC